MGACFASKRCPRHFQRVALFLIVVVLYFYDATPRLSPAVGGVRRAPVAPALPPRRIELAWLPVGALAHEHFSRRAPGCPSAPALCGLNDFFGTVIVIGLPRVSARVRRVVAQLNALRVEHILVEAIDAAEHWKLFPDTPILKTGSSRGATALFLTYSTLLAAVDGSNGSSVLVFEDDVTIAADIVTSFDSVVRRLPDDWKFFHLGSSIWQNNCRSCEPLCGGQNGDQRLVYYAPGIGATMNISFHCAKAIYGSFAFAFASSATKRMRSRLDTEYCPIDNQAFNEVWLTWPNLCFTAVPPLVASSPYTSLHADTSEFHSVSVWAHWNYLDEERFDFRGAGYIDKETSVPMKFCNDVSMEVGVQFFNFTAQKLIVGAPAECCEACRRNFIYCRAWTFSDDGLCELKLSSAGRAGVGTGHVSGDLGPWRHHPSLGDEEVSVRR
jgi:hypothetical protein